MGNWANIYKPVGTLMIQTDARGCSAILGYDDINRLTGKTYSATCSGNPVI